MVRRVCKREDVLAKVAGRSAGHDVLARREGASSQLIHVPFP